MRKEMFLLRHEYIGNPVETLIPEGSRLRTRPATALGFRMQKCATPQ
jgi:hypothetical protein